MSKRLKTTFWVIIMFSLLVIFVANIGEDTDIKQSEKPASIAVGDDALLNNNEDKTDCTGSSILGTNQDNYDQFISATNVDDKLGYLELLGNEQIFFVGNCTKVKVLDSAFAVRRVRILEGENLGVSGWIAYEFIK